MKSKKNYMLILENVHDIVQYNVNIDARKGNALSVTKIGKYTDKVYNSSSLATRNQLHVIDYLTAGYSDIDGLCKTLNATLGTMDRHFYPSGLHKCFIGSLTPTGYMEAIEPIFDDPYLIGIIKEFENGDGKFGPTGKAEIIKLLDMIANPNNNFSDYLCKEYLDPRNKRNAEFIGHIKDYKIVKRQIKECNDAWESTEDLFEVEDKYRDALYTQLSRYDIFRTIYLANKKYVTQLERQKADAEKVKEELERLAAKKAAIDLKNAKLKVKSTASFMQLSMFDDLNDSPVDDCPVVKKIGTNKS